MSRVQLLCRALPKLLAPYPPLDTFTLFSKLPPELRNRIWKYAAGDPRKVIVIIGVEYRQNTGQLPSPPILRTTRESRNEAKRYYTLCEDIASPPNFCIASMRTRETPPTKPYNKRPVWINFAVDIFTCGPEAFYHGRDVKTQFNFNNTVINQIQHVELVCRRGIDDLKKHLNNFKVILVQKSLASFTAVMYHFDESERAARLEREIGLLEGEKKLLEKIRKQQKWAGWSVQPQIGWKVIYGPHSRAYLDS
jgi:hypothetical protein